MAEVLSAAIAALGAALLHFVWQGALIGAAAALALRALRDARPQARYLVACVALLACVAAPLLTFAVRLAGTDAASAVSLSPLLRAFGGLPVPTIGDDAFARTVTMSSWLVAAWAAGTTMMFARMAMGLAWLRRLRNSPQPPSHIAWQARLDALALRIGLRRNVALRLVDTMDTPVSAGGWRPVVLLPVSLLTRLPPDFIDALLAHELAHVRRHDYLVNLAQGAIEALLFYHPVTWWLSRSIRRERELIADALAADTPAARRTLALALAELADLHAGEPVPHLAQAAHDGALLPRIRHLLAPRPAAPAAARGAFVTLALVALCSATLAWAALPAAAPAPAFRATFAFVPERGGDLVFWGPDDDLTAADVLRRGLGDDVLWVRANREDHAIADAVLVERARAAWRPFATATAQLDALEAAYVPTAEHERRMDDVLRLQDAAGADAERALRVVFADAQRSARAYRIPPAR